MPIMQGEGWSISRPFKRRRICAMPKCGRFGPADIVTDGAESICMTVDEFETIRLIDWEGMTQEQCALQMNVARTTAQAIYNSARRKIAECLLCEKELRIGGGEYELCNGSAGQCRRRCPHRQHPVQKTDRENRKEKKEMKIAVTYENGQVFQHFGHTEQFKLYEIEDGGVIAAEIVDTNGSGHGALAGFLKQAGVDTLICGGIGGGAQQALAEAGIELYGGVSGDADEAVSMLLAGNLVYNSEATCNHHGDHEHHGVSCGEHGCGDHSPR